MAGNLILLWLILSFVSLVFALPFFPRTESDWFLMLCMAPAGLAVLLACDEWIEVKHPKLRLLITPILFAAWVGILIWVISRSPIPSG